MSSLSRGGAVLVPDALAYLAPVTFSIGTDRYRPSSSNPPGFSDANRSSISTYALRQVRICRAFAYRHYREARLHAVPTPR